jgi:hypothetical protein
MAKAGAGVEQQLADDMGLKEELRLQMKKRLDLEEKNESLEKRVAELEGKLEKLLNGEPPKKPKVQKTEEEKRQAKIITQSLTNSRRELMAGRISAAVLEPLKTYCNTERRQEALVQAYHGYCNHHKSETWDEITYEEVMEELEKELEAKAEAKAKAKK